MHYKELVEAYNKDKGISPRYFESKMIHIITFQKVEEFSTQPHSVHDCLLCLREGSQGGVSWRGFFMKVYLQNASYLGGYIAFNGDCELPSISVTEHGIYNAEK